LVEKLHCTMLIALAYQTTCSLAVAAYYGILR
jgi:hypothetical protein